MLNGSARASIMKDDTSTPTPDESPNAYERDKPGTTARDDAEASIERVRKQGGVFVDAVRATRMPMAMTDPNLPGNPIVFANQAFLNLSGYRMDEVLGQQPYFMNGPETDSRDAARFRETLRGDLDDIIETVQYRKNGSRFVATVLLSAFKDEYGRTLNHFMSWLDVTRRVDAESEVAELKEAQAALRKSEQHTQTLLAELQHRVRNSLGIIGSIAKRTAENSESVEEMLADFQGRLDAFARVQAAVTRNREAKVDLVSIIEGELLAHVDRAEERVSMAGPEILVGPKTAERLSLAIHELTTNAVKYGALVDRAGRIRISWAKEQNAAGEELAFNWSESGVELDGGKPTREGFGMELLRRSLPYDVGGTTSVDFSPAGLSFELRMPLPDQAL